MPWVAQDDQFFTNPKARAVGVYGRELFAASWCWCSQQRNDGAFVAEDVPVIAALAQVPPTIADLLYSHHMWHPEGTDCAKCRAVGQTMPVPAGHVAVHEYLKQNKSRAQIIAAEERARKAAQARHAPGNASSNASSSATRTALPSHPIPLETNTPSSTGNSTGTSPPVDNPDDENVPSAVWEHYAQLMLAKQKPGDVEKPVPWKRKTAINAEADHAETAARWLHDFDVTPHQLAACLVDGKAPGSQYRRKDPT